MLTRSSISSAHTYHQVQISHGHFLHMIATNTGGQLLVLTAARLCLLSPCISLLCPKYKNPTLPTPGLCSCPVDDSLMQGIHGGVSFYELHAANLSVRIFFEGATPTLCWETMALSKSSLISFMLQHMDGIQQNWRATQSKNLTYIFRVSTIRSQNPSNELITKRVQLHNRFLPTQW